MKFSLVIESCRPRKGEILDPEQNLQLLIDNSLRLHRFRLRRVRKIVRASTIFIPTTRPQPAETHGEGTNQ
jgi:hypothetical protein